MRKNIPVFIIIFLVYLSGKAQRPEDLLNNWSARSPIEKVYLHFDRDNYLAGETIWFKSYLYSDFLPDTISTTLFVELFNENSVMVSRKILPVFLGSAGGQFELGDTLKTGRYIIRAYSSTMLNQDEGFIYKRSILVTGKKNSQANMLKQNAKAIRIEFFPEAGNFIDGMLNTIAFKATDENGLPVNVKGTVKNEKDETITELSSYHDGMGMFDINSKTGSRYYVQLNEDINHKKYYLPETSDKGIVLRVMPDPQGKYYEIFQKTGDPAFEAAYMIGQMQHHVVFKKDFTKLSDWMTGLIDIKKLNSGILQVTVFNKDGIPLAERLSFIDNKDYIQPAELTEDTLSFSERGKNIFTLSLKDTVLGSFSVAITDPDYNISQMREENIFSRLLLTSDLKGYIHNPAWYFTNISDSVVNALDLVMMTNGWRRFKWAELIKNGVTAKNYQDAGYITLTGKANIRDTRKPFAGKEMVVMISPADSSGHSMQLVNTDEFGGFKMDSLIFFDKARILFSDTRGRKSSFIEVKLSDDSLDKKYVLPVIDGNDLAPVKNNDSVRQSKLGYDYDAILRANGLLLEGITVKSRKKSPVQELEEKYASGLFSGFSEKTIDLVNTNEVVTQQNIFLYLQSRVPGLQVQVNGLNYQVYYRQTRSLMGGFIPMTLYLDEMLVDADFISPIPASQIAMVKVFSSFVGAAGNGAGGVLAVYTKKGSDFIGSAYSPADRVNYNGYSVIKEFYSPDYSVKTNDKGADHRITLHWQPDIFINSVNPKIPVRFYNNDRTKNYKIVVEGITWNGKMVMIEKIISAAGKRPF